MAGAVLRGSRLKKDVGLQPAGLQPVQCMEAVCFVTDHNRSFAAGKDCMRRIACAKRVGFSPKSTNCLGQSSRESGHRRVPLPPQKDNWDDIRHDAFLVNMKLMELLRLGMGL